MLRDASVLSSVLDEREDDTAFAPHPAPELTVVVPTLNERDNIVPFLKQLKVALSGVAWEVIFVDDDSSDGTADAVRSIARRDGRVRCLQRIGRRGLSTACIEGLLASASPCVAVMDADLQHDERLLPHMLETLKNEPYDLVVGSRYVPGGGVGDWDHSRTRISGFATRVSRLVCKTDIADPMSGYFMVRREFFEKAVRKLSGQGFKILLDLLASSAQAVRLKELPFQFGQRQHGESKLDTLVAWEFGMLLADKLIGHIAPVRLALFGLVGVLGLAVHLSALWTSLGVFGFSFVASQAVATITAMTCIFFLNNLFTYRDRRLKGARFIRSLLWFYLICGVGALANVRVASHVFTTGSVWWLAGSSGALVSLVWIYTVPWGHRATPVAGA